MFPCCLFFPAELMFYVQMTFIFHGILEWMAAGIKPAKNQQQCNYLHTFKCFQNTCCLRSLLIQERVHSYVGGLGLVSRLQNFKKSYPKHPSYSNYLFTLSSTFTKHVTGNNILLSDCGFVTLLMVHLHELIHLKHLKQCLTYDKCQLLLY